MILSVHMQFFIEAINNKQQKNISDENIITSSKYREKKRTRNRYNKMKVHIRTIQLKMVLLCEIEIYSHYISINRIHSLSVLHSVVESESIDDDQHQINVG